MGGLNIEEYKKMKESELNKRSREWPMRRVYALITFENPVSYDLAMKIAKTMEVESVDLKYTNSYAFTKFYNKRKTKDRIARVTEKINSKHEKLKLEPAYLEGVIVVRGYSTLGTLRKISKHQNVALVDFTLEGQKLPFMYYELHEKSK